MGKVGEEVHVIAKYDYTAQGTQELDLRKNERLLLIDDSKHWWKVQNTRNQSGYVPSNYVKREKPSIFDSIKRRVKKRSDYPKMTTTPSFRDTDVNVNPTTTIPTTGAETRTELPQSTSAIVKYNYEAQQPDEISLVKSTRVLVMEKSNDGWWRGEYNGKIGWFPSNYVQEENDDLTELHTYAQADSMLPPNPPVCLEVVVALYSFTSQNDEELNFQKGERLEVIDKPANDPEWWRARNSLGEAGLVPKNYVQIVTEDSSEFGSSNHHKTNGPDMLTNTILANNEQQLANMALGATGGIHNTDSLNTKPYYVGNITRSQCDRMLNDLAVDGDFLIRDSETNVGDYSVSLKAPGRNKHFRVHVEDGVYCIGQRKFSTLDELVEHYKRAPIYTSPKGDKMYLVKDFQRL